MARSIKEAGLNLLTFDDFFLAHVDVVAHDDHTRKSRSRFRRRTKTQASFSTELAALAFTFGLVAFSPMLLRTHRWPCRINRSGMFARGARTSRLSEYAASEGSYESCRYPAPTIQLSDAIGRFPRDAFDGSPTAAHDLAEPHAIVLLGTGDFAADPDQSGPATAVIVNDTPYLVDLGADRAARKGRRC